MRDDQNSNNSQQRRIPWPALIVGLIYQIIGNPSRDEAESKYQESQDRAGQRTANATVAIACFTAAILIVGVFQYLVTRGQLISMQSTDEATKKLANAALKQSEAADKQVTAMQSQLDAMRADQRPWIDIRDIKIADDITFDTNGARVTAAFHLVNTGRTPAVKVTPWFSPFLVKDGWLDKIKKFENPVAGDQGFFGDVVFPGNQSPIEQISSAYIPPSDVTLAEGNAGRPFGIMGQACVEYNLSLDDQRRHKTCYTFDIIRRNGFLLQISDPRGPILKDDIGGRFFPGGSFAD